MENIVRTKKLRIKAKNTVGINKNAHFDRSRYWHRMQEATKKRSHSLGQKQIKL